jgi:hypothetical protein
MINASLTSLLLVYQTSFIQNNNKRLFVEHACMQLAFYHHLICINYTQTNTEQNLVLRSSGLGMCNQSNHIAVNSREYHSKYLENRFHETVDPFPWNLYSL